MKPKKRLNKKRIVFILSAILVGIIVVFLPFIVEKLYYTKAPLKFFEVSYEAKDFLSYYGSVLSFAGATILGIFTGYVLWNPFATKLKTKTQDEVLMKNMTVEGILSIYHGESSSLIKEKMLSWLSETRQREIEAALGDVKEGTEDGKS